MKRIMKIAGICSIILLSGCVQKDEILPAAAHNTINPQSQALAKAENAGLLKEPEPILLSEWGAQKNISASLHDTYAVTLLEEQENGSDILEGHPYFIFEVRNREGDFLGEIAVDRVTGDKYHYLGEEQFNSFETFLLSDTDEEPQIQWSGEYTKTNHLSLYVIQNDTDQFVYHFSDGTEGTAYLSDNTAKSESEENTIFFLRSDEILTVIGKGVSGNYTLQAPAETPTEPAQES